MASADCLVLLSDVDGLYTADPNRDAEAQFIERVVEGALVGAVSFIYNAQYPGIVIEVLVPDFQDSDAAIETVLAANPQIFNHNLETVRRLTPSVRHRATYDRSLSVLKKVKDKRGTTIHTKSGSPGSRFVSPVIVDWITT